MSQSSLFISDLHLEPERETINRIFFDFLKQRAVKADALYILGDLFETWIGDDDLTDYNQQVITAFSEYSNKGKQLFFMHGNRDFLLGNEFMQQCGGQLLPDPSILELYGHKILLTHGDTLCTLDHEYQSFRETARSPQWQDTVLNKPLAERRAIAANMRAQSREKSMNKADNIMDVNPPDVLTLIEESKVKYLIHGHTHRPAVHTVTTSAGESTRIVLSDWDKSGHCLELNQSGFRIETFNDLIRD